MTRETLEIMESKEILLLAAAILFAEYEKRAGHGKSQVGPRARRLASEIEAFVAEVKLK